MDIATLRMLLEVSEAGSFAAVARERGVEPSSISRPIAALEASLGVRLLQRTTRAMALTEAGERYVAAITPAVEAIEGAGEAVSSSSDQPSGTVRLTASAAFGERLLAPLLPALRDAHPGLRLECVLTDANIDLVAERIDIALRLAPSYRADVVGVRLVPTRYRVVASPGHLARFGRPGLPGDLAQRGCVVSAVPAFRTRWMFRRERRIEPVFVRGDVISSNATLLRHAALDGCGPALLADWLIDDALADGRLIDLFPDHHVTATSFDTAAWLLFASREHMPARIRVTIDFLRSRLGGLARRTDTRAWPQP